MNSLLFSLPGTPVVYYGDEIGMGDNPFLGDRDGVRTPMQCGEPYQLTFSGHSFFWLRLLTAEEAAQQASRPHGALNQPDLPPSDQLFHRS